jgi:hypothetical protein
LSLFGFRCLVFAVWFSLFGVALLVGYDVNSPRTPSDVFTDHQQRSLTEIYADSASFIEPSHTVLMLVHICTEDGMTSLHYASRWFDSDDHELAKSLLAHGADV